MSIALIVSAMILYLTAPVSKKKKHAIWRRPAAGIIGKRSVWKTDRGSFYTYLRPY
jgi:hypothetical protein